MDKLINVLEKKLMPIANKISSIKFLNALGKSFQLLLPIIIIGSFACLGAYIGEYPKVCVNLQTDVR